MWEVRAFATVCVCGRRPELKQKPQRKKTSRQAPDQQGWGTMLWVEAGTAGYVITERRRESPLLAGCRFITLGKKAEWIFTAKSDFVKSMLVSTNMHALALHCVQSSVTLWILSVQRAPADSACPQSLLMLFRNIALWVQNNSYPYIPVICQLRLSVRCFTISN